MNNAFLSGVIATAICHTVMLGAAVAAESLADCRRIEADAARLACYDRFTEDPDQQDSPLRSEAARSATAAPDAPTVEPNRPGRTRDAAAKVESADVARRAATGQAPPAAPQADDEPDRIRARVTAVSERARGEHVVSLDNGQVWQQPFASRYFPVDPGDEVTIRKQFFGGYRLVTESGKGYRVERVR